MPATSAQTERERNDGAERSIYNKVKKVLLILLIGDSVRMGAASDVAFGYTRRKGSGACLSENRKD